MQIKVNTLICDLNGRPIARSAGQDTTSDTLFLRLGDCIIQALLTNMGPTPPSNPELKALLDITPDEKVRRFRTALRVHDGLAVKAEVVDLSVEDVATIKKLCSHLFTTLVYGRIYEAIESTDTAPSASVK